MQEIAVARVAEFIYQGQQPVRTARGPDGEPWFVLADLCTVLEIKNPTQVRNRMDPEDVALAVLDRDGGRGNPNVSIVSKGGMYEIVVRSNRPEARAFRKWITHDVLPAIEEHGVYATDEWKQELAHGIAQVRFNLQASRDAVLAGKTDHAIGYLDEAQREFVGGTLVGILGGKDAYRALL
jgi:prophage antirepressor-like protein